eukprot:CAMPEP_0197698036 /NCGR_PEP_ID=MMETSP1338-20131121/118780_1 /TAXON_ID=43686 ORGANISM="Pelagodinium beii, Strain RCC1491" /NCGR_SAMPLE_ID=MMETSP1338 /ASSEMBLY_ACC=CAM_ASM_000754 /LENGTH=433 /DNA_ID=CAMNT_0043281357 /DNA_START=158 /DNA_END=1458 /DNA_ORIENTATION=+
MAEIAVNEMTVDAPSSPSRVLMPRKTVKWSLKGLVAKGRRDSDQSDDYDRNFSRSHQKREGKDGRGDWTANWSEDLEADRGSDARSKREKSSKVKLPRKLSRKPTDETPDELRRFKPNSREGEGPRCGTKNQRPQAKIWYEVPQAVAPEILLIGRSNAGKSTLLNKLMAFEGLRDMSPSSSLGGRTRTLIWYPCRFQKAIEWSYDHFTRVPEEYDDMAPETELTKRGLQGGGCCLVDCFGLGEVQYSIDRDKMESWISLLCHYLRERKALHTVCHLISAEQEGSLDEGDLQLIELIQRFGARRNSPSSGMPSLQIVRILTKTDLYTPEQLSDIKVKLEEELQKRGCTSEKIISVYCHEEGWTGISDFSELVNSAAEDGWKNMEAWTSDTDLRKPQNYEVNDRWQKWNARKARIQVRQNKRGGRGESTELPPSV